MPVTVSFSEMRTNLTTITNEVINNRIPVTVFKHNKPVFKIVPIETDMQSIYRAVSDEVDEEYQDLFEALAK